MFHGLVWWYNPRRRLMTSSTRTPVTRSTRTGGWLPLPFTDIFVLIWLPYNTVGGAEMAANLAFGT
jgi:hypothetical protein